mgnify:CR=1 FL=1|tara:strand:- start:541 stop:1101 length:561 start_codon:yes stop_codon:yes gene_type:complete
MIAPLFLLLISAMIAVAGFLPGLSDLLLLGGPCIIASAILLIKSLRRDKTPKNWIIIDGSNVMYWRGGEPDILTVRDVVDYLRERGFTPGVVFDANAGYLLAGRYQHDRALSLQLDLPQDRVMVVPKGNPADPFILKAARDYGAKVVSKDRFRDWAETHPEVAEPGNVVKGGYRKGKLWLDLGEGE